MSSTIKKITDNKTNNTMKKETRKTAYESPQTEAILIALEQSIANGSGTLDDLTINELLDELDS